MTYLLIIAIWITAGAVCGFLIGKIIKINNVDPRPCSSCGKPDSHHPINERRFCRSCWQKKIYGKDQTTGTTK